MKSNIAPVFILLAASLSCGSGNRAVQNQIVSGPYEFVVTSNATGSVTLIEANLSGYGNQIAADGASQVQILSLENKIWYVNGVCPGNSPGQNSISASSVRGTVAIAFSDGGNAVSGQGVVNGTTINANYSVTGSSCPDLQANIGFTAGTDTGGIVGNSAVGVSGTFTGTLNLPSGLDNVSLKVSENADHTLNVTAVVTGSDNGTFPLTGSAMGNMLLVSGQVGGRTVTLLGYYDRAGVYTKMPNSLLVFNYATSANAGLLLGQ